MKDNSMTRVFVKRKPVCERVHTVVETLRMRERLYKRYIYEIWVAVRVQ